MKRYPYSPFAGELSAVNAPALAGLREVGAGWYIAYEESLPPASELAKHLAAFANQSGGWLFLGVAVDKNNRKTVCGFPGVPATAAADVLARLHEAAGAHVTPEVCFEAKTVEGPAPELDLPEGRSIVVIGVPQGGNPPYIHASGEIYRRDAASSRPVLETDRHAFDLLSGRRIESQQRLAEFFSGNTELAEYEKRALVNAHLYLLEDPFLTGGSAGLSYEDFCGTMRANNAEELISAGFSTCFTTPDGYVATLKKGKEPLAEVITFRWWNGGNARISIPISAHLVDTFPLYSDPQRADFIRLLRAQGLDHARVADLSQFLAALAVAVAKYLRLRSVAGLNQPFWAKIRFCQCWRIVPFINLRQYVEILKARGVPQVQDDDFCVPPGVSAAALIKIEPAEPSGTTEQALRVAFRLAAPSFRALGINLDGFAKNDPQAFLRDLADSMKTVRRS